MAKGQAKSGVIAATAVSTFEFPKKPERGPNQKPPGIPVELITNLYKLSLKQNKIIYRYGVTIELENQSPVSAGDGSSEKGGEKPVRKSLKSHDVRRKALNKAIIGWIKNNKPSDCDPRLQYSYVYDSNGSTICTLFDMFKGDKNAKKLAVRLDLEAFIDGKLGIEQKEFLITINPGETLNIDALFEYCKGKRTTNPSHILEATRAFNIIFQSKICTIPSIVMTPNNVYDFKKDNIFPIKAGVVGVKGYSLSVRPTECGLVVNVANSVGAFYEEIDLLSMLSSRFGVRDFVRGLNPMVIEKLKREILNKQIEARHKNYGSEKKPSYRKYRVKDIKDDSNNKFTLADKNTKQVTTISIKDYFKKEYGVTIKYPNLPCIIDHGGRKIPLEVCHLIDKQRVLRRMDPQETATIIKEAALRPEVHFRQIEKSVKFIKDNCQPAADFGLDFDTKPIEVTGRELPPAKLVDGMNREIRPNNGEYRGDKFYKPATIRRWVLTVIVDQFVDRDIGRAGANQIYEKKFDNLYTAEGRYKGVRVEPMAKFDQISLKGIVGNDRMFKNTLRQYFNYLNKNKVDHAIFLLPQNIPEWTYRYLQYLEVVCHEGRVRNEPVTRHSCIKYDNYTRKIINDRSGGKMFLSNLWLKYNTKLGGINYALKGDAGSIFLQEGYIFISIDVCHPAPGDKLSQSVAALVGMWDLNNQRMSFSTQLRVQRKQRPDHSTVEEVGEVGQMFEEVIEAYRQKKNTLPTKIVIIRDGVSEGQLRMVLESEVRKVRAAINNKYKKYNEGKKEKKDKVPIPPLTCMVVQKRHKIRFMRKIANQTPKGPNFNIQPGTVVDSHVTHPTDFDFYLAPHKAIQGTAKAAHVHVILDEINFTQDQAQAMVLTLSYLSPRCTKSTSIPTPVNLADLAAEQGKNLVVSWCDDNVTNSMSEDEKITKLNAFLCNLGEENYKNTLYYI